MPDTPAVRVKICGLRDPDHVAAAADAGAAYLGFNFVPGSPRSVDLARARKLATDVPPGLGKVALTADALDPELDEILDTVPVDMLQLHGTETPLRVAEVKARYGLPVMKAIGIAEASDLDAIDLYAHVADQLLLDTKPPKDAALLGGTGHSFDWGLLQGRRWPVPWMLAGGLTADNVAQAIRITGAQQVDTASGVERERGIKDADLIREFVQAATSIDA